MEWGKYRKPWQTPKKKLSVVFCCLLWSFVVLRLWGTDQVREFISPVVSHLRSRWTEQILHLSKAIKVHDTHTATNGSSVAIRPAKHGRLRWHPKRSQGGRGKVSRPCSDHGWYAGMPVHFTQDAVGSKSKPGRSHPVSSHYLRTLRNNMELLAINHVAPFLAK